MDYYSNVNNTPAGDTTPIEVLWKIRQGIGVDARSDFDENQVGQLL